MAEYYSIKYMPHFFFIIYLFIIYLLKDINVEGHSMSWHLALQSYNHSDNILLFTFREVTNAYHFDA